MDEENLQTPSDKPKRRKKSTGRIIWGITKWIMIVGFTLGLFGGGIAMGYVSSIVKDDPVRSAALIDEKIHENSETGFVYFNDGTLVGQLRTDEDRRLIALKDIPQQVIDAVIAIEDNNFYNHIGIDLNGVFRAVKQKVLNENIQTGGSTLTQQLARRVFLNLDRTTNRKIKEIFLSIRLERYLTKDEILTAYLNKVPFGNGNTGYNLFGVKAAAKGIFNLDLNKINLAQAAYIAGLPQLPSAYSAFNGKGSFNEKGFNRAIERQKLVLRRMYEEAKITKQQYDEALSFNIKSSLAEPKKKAYDTYPYLMMEAERSATEALVLQQNPSLTVADLRKKENAELMNDAREQMLRSGYKIYLTIDKKIYDAMRSIASDPKNFSPDSKTKGIEQTAAVMLDHKTGAILGMIEGRDFYVEQMNYATQMLRQPGSAMKTIGAYLPAIDSGKIQPASILDDAPIVLKDGTKGFHIPKNANNRYQGLVTARTALNQSLNLPALKIFLEKVGIEKAWEFVKTLGITSIQPEDYYAQTGVIGGLKYGVSVEELTNAYGAIPNNGVFNDAYIVQKIVDTKGTIVYQHTNNPQQVFSEQTAYLMQDMLRTVIAGPSGTAGRLRGEFNKYGKIPIAGKTGSTQNYADVWFMGFTPDVTLGVWAGYEQQINTLTGDGKARARKLWATIMNKVTDIEPELFQTSSFKKPDGIVSMTVSGFSGKLPTDLTRQANRLVTDIFNKKFIPTQQDDGIVNMKVISYNGVNYIAQDSTPADMVQTKVVVKREKPIQDLVDEITKALSKMSASSRKSIQSYLPSDANLDAPSQVDPRVDDGNAPSAPQNLQTQIVNGKLVITFTPSGQADVVGYRLYRSMNGGSYQIASDPVLTGQTSRFSNFISGNNGYSFYITAVDVGGHESAPSMVVTPNGGSSEIPGTPNTPDPNVPNPGSSGETNPGSSENTGSNTASNAPEKPTKLNAKSSNLGLELTWQSKQPAKEYKIYLSDKKDGKYSYLATSSIAHFEYIGTGLTGWYQVTAVNDVGESAPSSPVYFKE
ncbi:carboxypeptidase [Paenibacillus selenitireducens]|uniref:Carboxypeptidase n=1 Tax=Paenibacillus selenitireducens TaxID=1324314 RepID=A0A1T2XFG2_9BACL|nr:transglycosylase domain-containing protein [Paenibacillus selenitireducens]OPA78552.1 carboxypeptidase [Paenibacillus selenitireducens]